MRKKLLRRIMLALALVMLVTSAALADKLLCVSRKELKGEDTVGACVARGDQFAVMDDKGVIRILSPKEIELMKETTPHLFDMQAYGVKHRESAPEIPTRPPLAVPKTGAR